jgi:hypothetical protein
LNLFGNFGAYPLFPFYRTDEFSSSLSLSIDAVTYRGPASIADWQSERHPGSAETMALILDHFFSFEGEKEDALTFENRFNLNFDRGELEGTTSWGDTIKFLYTWYRYPEGGVKIPLLPQRIGEKGYWSHQESVISELSGPGEASSFHPFNLIVSHKSSVLLPDHGEINAEISAGFDIEKTEAGERYWRMGLSGGIGVKIEF